MKNTIRLLFCMFLMIVFNNKVYANHYNVSLTTKSSETLKVGDVVEISGGICSLIEGEYIDSQDILLIFDSEIFDVIEENVGDGLKKIWYGVREGWEDRNSSYWLGKFSISLRALSPKYNITSEESSVKCNDNINANLVTIKLKVKKVINQSTKIQLINGDNYVSELKFNIYNKSSNNFLSNLEVSGHELDKKFNKNNTEYEVFVPYDVDSISITAMADDSKAVVTGVEDKILTVGENKIDILVTAENGEKKTYTLLVNRKNANSDKSLSKILVKDSFKQEVALKYNEQKKLYEGDVSSDVSFVTFDIVCSGVGCFVSKLEPELVIDGKNEFQFTVTSQNDEMENYTIVINKEVPKEDYTVLYFFVALIVSIIINIVMIYILIRRKK